MTDFMVLALCIGGAFAVGTVMDGFKDIAKKRMRRDCIVAQGWPPPHCDADGDPVLVDQEES